MLIKTSSSSSCRGWEGNSSGIIETEHPTLREYLITEIIMYDYDMTREESIEELDSRDSNEWGGWTGKEDEYDYEGEECTVSYRVFKPTQEYIDMLTRNL